MSNLVDLTGQRFGKLTVLKRAESHITPSGQRLTYWRCQCDCGRVKEVKAEHLKRGRTASCGKCISYVGENNPAYKHGGKDDRLYSVWNGMKQRCGNPHNPKYYRYGDRGITVCSEWNEYVNFKKWAYENGYDDTAEYGKCTLDRINLDGNYEPSNCRWVDEATQARNRSTNFNITYKGETKILSDWASEFKVGRDLLKKKLLYENDWDKVMAEFEKNKQLKCELYNDSFQNFRRYGIPKAQLVIADIPFNIGNSFFGSRVDWYIGGG